MVFGDDQGRRLLTLGPGRPAPTPDQLRGPRPPVGDRRLAVSRRA